MTRISKLWQLDQLPHGTQLVNTRGVTFTKETKRGFHLLKTMHGYMTTKTAAESYGPFTIKETTK